MSTSVLERLERVLDSGGEPDDVLREVVSTLATESGIGWAGVAFLEAGALTLGPAAGEPDESRRMQVPIVFQDSEVGGLLVDGDADRELLDRVAALLSGHVLIGWDTRGEAWDP